MAYRDVILAESSLKAFYEFNETLRRITDYSDNGNHACATSSGLTTGQTGPNADGHNAILFDGVNGYIVSRPISQLSRTGPYTIEALIKSGGVGHFFGTRAPNDLSLDVSTDTTVSGNMHADIGTGSAWITTAANATFAWPATTWFHVALVVTTTSWTWYVNGSSVATGSFASATPLLFDNTHVCYIGWDGLGSDAKWSGTIADVAIYASALSSGRISSHAGNVGSSAYATDVLSDSPVAFWRLDDDSASWGSMVVNDSSSNANNGTITDLAATVPGPLGPAGGTHALSIIRPTSYAQITPVAPTSLTGAFSVEFWVPNGVGGRAFGSRSPNDFSFDIGIQNAADIGTGSGWIVTGQGYGGAMPGTSWWHVVWVIKTTGWEVWVNGVQEATGSYTGTPLLYDANHHVFIGGNGPAGDTHLQGAIAYLAIYNAALTSTQISAHYNAMFTLSLTGTSLETETDVGSIQGITIATPLPIYTLMVRENATGKPIDVIDDPIRVQAALNFNGVSQLLVTMDPTSSHLPSVAQDPDGNYLHGLVLARDNQDGLGPIELFSGPISHFSTDADFTQSPPQWTVLVTADSDDTDLDVDLALPDTDENFATNAYDTRTSNVSTLMWQYVNFNIGPGAHAERVISNLILDADPGLGGSVTEAVRFNTLLETLVNLSLRANPELGFQVRQPLTDTRKHFRIYLPRNQTSLAVFSSELGNVSKLHFQADQPVANVAYAGGAGSGTSRLFAIRTNNDSITRWGRRIEKFYNHSNLSNLTDLQNQADADLAADADVFALGVEVIESDGCVFLRDWGLGDLVTVVVNIPGLASPIVIQDVVRQVVIDLQQGKRDVVTPVIGAPGATFPLTPNRALHKLIYRAQRQVTTLQNNQ